ncbi:hypothetical protein FOA52_009790 [Chlamydomonas sp. UWO 241]|nr:hypothetical protein FOA52_009790 [Chlamydomonas sp. UWO 241]
MPPPVDRRDLRTLVRKIGASARPSQQREALTTLMHLVGANVDVADLLSAVAAAGAIPPLVKLLDPGADAGMHEMATVALVPLLQSAEDCAAAMPPLVQLLGRGSPDKVQSVAAAGLWSLADNPEFAPLIAAAVSSHCWYRCWGLYIKPACCGRQQGC